jgi:hypothetical protein
MPTSNENVAKNLKVIKEAIDQHNSRCPGEIIAILMHPIEVERLDFDKLYGIEIRPDENQQTGTFYLLCELEAAPTEDAEDADELEPSETVTV